MEQTGVNLFYKDTESAGCLTCRSAYDAGYNLFDMQSEGQTYYF